ncbi:hypothetical protein BRD03_06945 [Halobacteriales archaeon QS_9_68_17]|nr:MAG: hypothetical protein BRD03_06945 [Halobacteriales archaeon QS_9_68_17]
MNAEEATDEEPSDAIAGIELGDPHSATGHGVTQPDASSDCAPDGGVDLDDGHAAGSESEDAVPVAALPRALTNERRKPIDSLLSGVFDREALLLGLVPSVSLVLLGVSIRIPERLSVVGVAALLVAGPAGGYVAGTLAAGGRRRRAIHSLVSGAAVGVPVAGTLVYAIHESEAPRRTAYWWFHYAVATNTPPSVVVDCGYYSRN